MHPSLMPSWFAPPMPYHPEELCKHVRQLEQIYVTISTSDTNARTALAKAIISATASFVEGCLDALIEETLATLAVPQPIKEHVRGTLRGRGLRHKTSFIKERLAALKNGWQVEQKIADLIEEDLRQLRNSIDHGNVVQAPDLRLDDIAYFRRAAYTYLEKVYASVGVAKPGWLGNY